ncbi:MAG: PVC-type heme-binding CxxCH protein [Planctomycetota bacterium]|jgi:putative membrane-bound dehydrogenase-like protein
MKYSLAVSAILLLNQITAFGADQPSLRVKPLSPEESLKSMVVQPGFRLELVAAEPLIQDPVAVDFDEQGRMYVIQLPPYNAYAVPEFKELGSIVRLEDVDSDGQYEKKTVFADELKYPSAIACWDGGVFVGDAPDLLYLKDTDGDGEADQRDVVFTGFATDKAGESHLNSIRWGFDNRFHLSTSLAGGNIVATADKDAKPVSVRGRGFIFDPRDLTKFELTSGGGQHGMSMDNWGRKFTCGNSQPGLSYMYDDRYIARNPQLKAPAVMVDVTPKGKFTHLFRISPPEPWRQLRTTLRREGKFRGSDEGGKPFGFFTGATGITVYRGDAWPADHRGNVIVGEVANNLVYRAQLKPKGVGVTAVRADQDAEFIASRDIWFRPVQFANAPDGTLYILDMYRELIEGAAFLPPEFLETLDAMSGHDRGRIYRIAPANFGNRRKQPQLGKASTADLVRLLEHANGWHRDTASRLLYQRQDQSAVPALEKLAVESSLPEGRAAAVTALAGLDALEEKTILTALEDKSPDIRIHALRSAEALAPKSQAIRAKLAAMTSDESLLVRYQLAFSLGAAPGTTTTQALVQIALKDAADSWLRLAVLSSLHQNAGPAFEQLAGNSSFRKSTQGASLLSTLAEQIGSAGNDGEIALVVRAVGTLPDAEKTLKEGLVKSLVARQTDAGRKKLLAAAGGQTTELLAGLVAAAKATASDANASDDKRAQAIQNLRLTGFDDAQPLLEKLLQPGETLPVQAAAIQSAAAFRDDGVAELLLEAWPTLSPGLRVRASETLLSRPTWLDQFLTAVEDGIVKPFDIPAARVDLLRKHPNASIAARVNRLFVVSRKSRQEVVERYQAALQAKGNAERGKAVFKKNCSACHKLEGVGRAIGADLKGIRQRGMASVLLNVLDPNREVKPEFMTYTLLTNDGRSVAGMIGSETANDLVIRQLDGNDVEVRRADIELLQNSGLSFMPEGLEKTVSVEQMADLLSYLNSIE